MQNTASSFQIDLSLYIALILRRFYINFTYEVIASCETLESTPHLVHLTAYREINLHLDSGMLSSVP
jgi:hypothetical protein